MRMLCISWWISMNENVVYFIVHDLLLNPTIFNSFFLIVELYHRSPYAFSCVFLGQKSSYYLCVTILLYAFNTENVAGRIATCFRILDHMMVKCWKLLEIKSSQCLCSLTVLCFAHQIWQNFGVADFDRIFEPYVV